MLSRRLSSLFCWCLVSIIAIRDCQTMQVDLNANLQNSHSHKDLDRRTLEKNAAASLDVVDTEQLRLSVVIRRMHSTDTDAAAEVEKTEGDEQINGKRRTVGLLEEEEDEEDDEEEEEWLPVFNGGKPKASGEEEEHRDEKRVKRDGGSDGKESRLQEEDATDGRHQQHQHHQHQQQHQQQYTTLHTRIDDDKAADELHGEAGKDAVDHRADEEKEERDDDRSSEAAAKDSETIEEGSDEETGKERQTVKQRDGEVNAEAEASIDDDDEEEEEKEDEEDDEEEEDEEGEEEEKDEVSKEDETSSEEKIAAETDGEQQTIKKTSEEEDSSETNDSPTEDDTQKQDDALDEDDTQKQDDALDEDDTQKQDDALDEDDIQKKPVTSEVEEEESEKMTEAEKDDDQTSKKEDDDENEEEEGKDSMDHRRRVGSGTITQKEEEEEDDDNSDERLTNSGLLLSKGKDKESAGEVDQGSGEEKDEKIDFHLSDHLDHRADDTSDEDDDESEEAATKDDESSEEEETDDVDATALSTDDDDDDDDEEEDTEDEAKKDLTVTPKEKDSDEDSEKLPLLTSEDKDDNGKDESDKYADEGSGEVIGQNIEPRTGGEHEPDNPDDNGGDEEDGKDGGVATEEQSIRRSDWRYYGANGPGNWSKTFSGCESSSSSSSSSRFQSPISIVPDQTHLNDTLQAIIVTPKHTEKKCNSVLFNDAKTVKVIFENMSVRVKVDDRNYQVAWVQFHWGNTKDTGSEHVIAGKRFPLEMQVVCYDEESFPDVMETEWVADKESSSKILVLATLFEISDADNPLISSIVANLNSIQSPGQNISIPTVNLKGLLPKSDYYYRYSGSLTSPPCQGGAEWIVFKEHQTISSSQLSKFHELHEEDFEDGNYTRIDYNWRPIQPLNDRVVTRNFPILHVKTVNPKTLKPSAVQASSSFSHRSPAIDIFYVCTFFFVCKLFLV